MSITQIMSQHHGECDEIFFNLESSFEAKDWDSIQKAVPHFVLEMKKHFSIEEDILFPAYEQAGVITGGPINVMRMEHVQMRHLFQHLLDAMEKREQRDLTGTWETIQIMMQQHNMKEEGLVYPMIDQTLGESLLGQVEQELAAAA